MRVDHTNNSRRVKNSTETPILTHSVIGYEVTLQFIDLDIADSEKCNGDFVEIRKGNRTGELVSFYCGNQTPPPIKNRGDLWVLFESKPYDGTSAKGFLAEFIFSKENEITGTSGQISSPLYPQCYHADDKIYSWRILGAPNTKIVMKFIDSLFADMDCSEIAYFDIYDGYSKNAPLLKRVCYNDVSTIESNTNVVYMEYTASITSCNKFLLEWQRVSVARSRDKKRNNTCGSDGIIDMSNMTEYNLTSPGYPRGYGKGLKCEWIFGTRPELHLYITFTDVDLERFTHSACWSDKISIYSGNNIGDMKLVSTVCSFNASKNLVIPYGNLLKVVFTTNDYANGTGFAAKVVNSTN